jgi:hypothetical protein
MPSWRGVCDRRAVHRDTERNGVDIRLHVRLLYHPPRMISTIGHADYSDQIMPSIYGPNYANLPYSQNSSGPPSSAHQQAVLLNWSRHLFFRLYMRRYPNTFQRYSNRQTPYYDETLDGLLVLHLRRGDFDQHCWNFIEHSSGYNSFDELPDRFSMYIMSIQRAVGWRSSGPPCSRRDSGRCVDQSGFVVELGTKADFADAQNPWTTSVGPGFDGSTCRFPQLTSKGLDDAFAKCTFLV